MRALHALPLLALVALGACDSGSSTCGPVPSSAARGTFAFQFEEDGGCFTFQGSSARFGTQGPLTTDDSVTFAVLVPDDEPDEESTTHVQFLAVGDGPLPVGVHNIADLYTRSSAEYAPPPGDARLTEYPGQVAVSAVLGRNETAFSRRGTITVTRSGPDGYAGRIDATLSVQESSGIAQDRPGATLRLQGAFDLEPGANVFYIVL